ncbi:hypothetical protein [Streptomyces exfoliatus]|uniref:hypothetical protein n=1 Tax=Streptomyces exfoliatus TaxID=1905 RepID=UPI003C2BDF1F
MIEIQYEGVDARRKAREGVGERGADLAAVVTAARHARRHHRDGVVPGFPMPGRQPWTTPAGGRAVRTRPGDRV